MRRETTSWVMVASGPKVSFWPDGSTSRGMYLSFSITLESVIRSKVH
jgi:hypothetical protein